MRNIEKILKKTDKEVAQFLKNSYEFCSLKRKAFEEKAMLVSGDNLKSMEEQRGMILDSCKDELECLSGAYDAQVYEMDVYRRDGFIEGDDEIEIICMVIDEVKSSQFSSIILDECKSLRGMSKSVWVIMSNNKERYSNLFPEFYALIQKEFQPSPSEIKAYYHGKEVSSYGVEHGFVDYDTLRRLLCCMMNNFVMEETVELGLWWEIVSTLYADSDGLIYPYNDAQERICELEEMLEEDPENASADKWERDIELLEKPVDYEWPEGITQYYIISECSAEFLIENTKELIFYNEELNMYLWAIFHFGNSWEIELTDIPLSECRFEVA